MAVCGPEGHLPFDSCQKRAAWEEAQGLSPAQHHAMALTITTQSLCPTPCSPSAQHHAVALWH